MMDEKAKSGHENQKGGNHKIAEEDSFSVRYMMANEKSKKVHQQEQKILRIELNQTIWMQQQLQQDVYDNIVAERKYMEIMISYRQISEETLRHRQAGSSFACTTQFNRMSMQMQTLQDELVEVQRFKQRKVHKIWWYKYKNRVSQGPTIMDSLEKLLKVCNRIIVQICELESYVSPTQEMLPLLPKSWKFKFKHGVSKREVHNWSRNKSFTCELLFKWTVLLFFGSLLRPPELKHAFMNLEGKVLSRREICCRKSRSVVKTSYLRRFSLLCFGEGLSLHPTVQLESDQRLSLKQYHH